MPSMCVFDKSMEYGIIICVCNIMQKSGSHFGLLWYYDGRPDLMLLFGSIVLRRQRHCLRIRQLATATKLGSGYVLAAAILFYYYYVYPVYGRKTVESPSS